MKNLYRCCVLFLVGILNITHTIAKNPEKDTAKRSFFSFLVSPPGDSATSKEKLEYRSEIEDDYYKRDSNFVDIGGAVRFNYVQTIYDGNTFPLGTTLRNDLTWDTWRININARNKGILLSFEYRFYPTFNTHFVHHGWFGYTFSKNLQLQFGISQVPFGNLKYASHSWWFQTPYYVGLEDDYDIGLKLLYQSKGWNIDLAYYPLAEPRGTNDIDFGARSTARYSYDVVPVDSNNNIERNQFNLRVMREFNNLRLGVSGQYTEIYNTTTEHSGDQLSLAAHSDIDYGKWNLKSEVVYYNFNNVQNDAGEKLDAVQMGAYGFGTYDVASEAIMYVTGLSYSLDVDFGPVSNITFYNDYTYTQKEGNIILDESSYQFSPTHQNVLGALVSAGNVYTYIDWASGVNHPWLTNNFGGSALGAGNFTSEIDKLNWNHRFNINVGYYF